MNKAGPPSLLFAVVTKNANFSQHCYIVEDSFDRTLLLAALLVDESSKKAVVEW
jgi:hypothetical protein